MPTTTALSLLSFLKENKMGQEIAFGSNNNQKYIPIILEFSPKPNATRRIFKPTSNSFHFVQRRSHDDSPPPPRINNNNNDDDDDPSDPHPISKFKTLSDSLSSSLSTPATPLTRRIWLASTFIAAGVSLRGNDNVAVAQNNPPSSSLKYSASSSSSSFTNNNDKSNNKLQWAQTPVNKRTGVTVFDAEKVGYNVRFVTYLSRFLLVFDADCRQWWYQRAGDLPRTGNAETIQQLRLQQFGAFSASVEVGLQEYYSGEEGPSTLLSALVNRFCSSSPTAESPTEESNNVDTQPQQQPTRDQREIKEARRQIALLFCLMETNQPVDEITKLLAAIDNGSIASITIQDKGSGYAPGYGPPAVTFPPPEAGSDQYQTAKGRAVLKPNGKLLRIDVINRGACYKQPPTVTISPPALIRFGDLSLERGQPPHNESCTATAQAFLFRSGVNKGRVERIQLIDAGNGYTANEIIRVRLTSPEASPQEGAIAATAAAVLEFEVANIVIVNNGTGYAVEKPIRVSVEPPPLTARVNMNDPLLARIISPNEPLPASTIPTKQMLKKMLPLSDPSSVAARANLEASRGGAGGCVGRACYDRPVVAIAYARAEKDSYNAYRSYNESLRLQNIENALESRSAASSSNRIISGSSSSGGTGYDASDTYTPLPYVEFAGGRSSSSQLLWLLPAGIGLEFDSTKGRYQLAVDPTVDGFAKSPTLLDGENNNNILNNPSRGFDPDFGPRGRSPIERDMEIGIASYLRFVASGAICCSGVHLALTPIDVIKTKVQTDPQRYPGVVPSFRRVWNEQGWVGFYKGWAPTFVGFFFWGGASYALTEFLRRSAADMMGTSASNLDVPVILASSAIAAFFCSFILCPFEAVRIRSVAQPDYAPNIVQVLNRMVNEEGVPSLFSAVPPFLLKEIPFAMAKFTVFDVATAYLYEQFPAATEDLQLSLLVSLTGGTLAGFAAAVVSNPADVTISEMKKTKSNLSPVDAASLVLEQGGPAALFRGLPLRLAFNALLVSVQFLVYDAVRFALGIGSDDLKLYLDVLGGALSESGGNSN